jgi:hypothetical protein
VCTTNQNKHNKQQTPTSNQEESTTFNIQHPQQTQAREGTQDALCFPPVFSLKIPHLSVPKEFWNLALILGEGVSRFTAFSRQNLRSRAQDHSFTRSHSP